MARRVKLNRANWFSDNRKALMQRYINQRNNPLFWGAWLTQEYDTYRNTDGDSNSGR